MAMTVRLPDELNEQLKAQAEAERISVHTLLLRAAEEYLLRHSKRALIEETVGKIQIQYAEALRRLGE